MWTHNVDRSGRVMDRVRQMWGALHGHDALLQFQGDRMFLRCASCGHETPGWAVAESRRVPIVRSMAPAALRPPLVRERRVA